jgi:hypothetical protein
MAARRIKKVVVVEETGTTTSMASSCAIVLSTRPIAVESQSRLILSTMKFSACVLASFATSAAAFGVQVRLSPRKRWS